MDVDSVDDKRQRNDTPVYQQMSHLLPFFSSIRRIRADGLLRKRRFHYRPINTLPGYPSHLAVLGQPCSPERLEEKPAA
jgi:hypothetical protein